MVPYFAESLQVSNLHCETCRHNTLEYVRGGVEEECLRLCNNTQRDGVDGSRVGNHTTFQGLAARGRAGWARFFSDFYLEVKNVFLFYWFHVVWFILHDIVSSVYKTRDVRSRLMVL